MAPMPFGRRPTISCNTFINDVDRAPVRGSARLCGLVAAAIVLAGAVLGASSRDGNASTSLEVTTSAPVTTSVSADDVPSVLAARLDSATSSTTTTTTLPPTTTIVISTTSAATVVNPLPGPSCAATMSTARPTRNTTVTLAVTSNQVNKPVEVSVKYRTMNATLSGLTDASGTATVPVAIGTATTGYTVDVDIVVGTAHCSTNFTPL